MLAARASFLRLCGRQSLQRLPQCSLLPYKTYSSYNGSTAGGWSSSSRGQEIRNQISSFTKGPSSLLGSVSCFSNSSVPPDTPTELSSIMLLDDTNPNGVVYGGTTLKLIEQAGHFAANKHCNKEPEGLSPLMTVLARVDHVDFYHPLQVGEMAQLKAAVTYTSPRSIEVTVEVWAENSLTRHCRHTNTATLWYVAIPADVEALRRGEGMKAIPVPQIEGLSEEEMAKGKKRYEAQKAARSAGAAMMKTHRIGHHQIHHHSTELDENTVLASQTSLANFAFPSDCYITGHLMGGSLMKTMDNVAGLCASRHCYSRLATTCIDAVNFHSPVQIGEAAFVTAKMVFTSTRSMEVEVITEAEGFSRTGRTKRRIISMAYFTYATLRKDSLVPPLKLESDEERQRFEEGRRRYEDRKRKLKQTSR